MERIALNADLRTQTGKGFAHRLRQAGKIPAVFYGKGQGNLQLSLSVSDLEKAVATEAGMNVVLLLKVAGKGEFDVLLKEYQADSIKRNFTHADFMHVDLTKKIQVSVPVHLTGRPEGLKEGGILEQVARSLEVLCLPLNIPKQIDVDVTALKIGQNLHLSDMKLPEGVESAESEDVTIAIVTAPKEEELTPGVMTEPEVLTAKKEEGEGAAAAPGAEAKGGKEASPAKEAEKGEKKK